MIEYNDGSHNKKEGYLRSFKVFLENDQKNQSYTYLSLHCFRESEDSILVFLDIDTNFNGVAGYRTSLPVPINLQELIGNLNEIQTTLKTLKEKNEKV